MASLTSLKKRYTRSIDSKDFYGAEQACRMLHHRITQSKTATDADRSEALIVVLDGAKALLENNQIQAGTALGSLACKHCVQYVVPVSEKQVLAFEEIAAAYFATDVELTDEGKRELFRFLKGVLAWSSRTDCGGFEHGHERLNKLTAHAAADIGKHELAQNLFVYSDDPQGAAEVTWRYANESTLPSEKPLVLTRMILKYLVHENLSDAIEYRRAFVKCASWRSVEDGSDGSDVPPLANFSELLLKLCRLESRAASLFERVCGAYQAELDRDPQFNNLLTKIGQLYLGIVPPQPSGLGGMMGNMLRGMMAS